MVLQRHELPHRDGRRLFVYGDLRGSLDAELPEQGEQAAIGPETPGLHQRLDRLTATWIAVSPARNTRLGDRASDGTIRRSGDAVACLFCPGGPELPFSYEAAVFENRFPSLVAAPPPVAADPRISPSQGRCEVVLYTERHDGSLATLDPGELARLLAIWRDRSDELWADPRHRYVMVFENRGPLVGATISHPHGQVYAFDHVPPLISARAEALARHREDTGRCLSCDVVADDLAAPERTIASSEAFTVGVPFAARFPFEVHVRARRSAERRVGKECRSRWSPYH
jgi:Galactose-1-phosphate uridylyltransferase